MCYFRNLLLPLAVVFGLLLTGALAQPPRPPAPSSSPAKLPDKPQGDPAAGKVLDEAIRKLDLKTLGWVETTLWEQVDLQGLTFQAEGTYLAGPDRRLHLDLKVHLGDVAGRLELVCDGTTLGEALQVGSGERYVTRKVDMKKVLEAMNGSRIAPEVREEFFRNQSFAGLTPMLERIKKQMVCTRLEEKVRWNDRDTFRVTAVWSPEATAGFPQPDQPPYLSWPQRCLVYLDAETLWPWRLEWWGPAPSRLGDVLMLQMEFRNPKLGQPPSADQLTRAFTFDRGTGEVPDWTDREIGMLKLLAQQAAEQKKKPK